MDNLQSYSIPALVRAAAEAFGSKNCVFTRERQLNFSDFELEVHALAQRLRDQGVTAYDRVAVLDVNSIMFLEILCAVGLIGACAVPLNYRQKVQEHRYQIDDSGARLLLAANRYAKDCEALVPSLPLGILSIEDLAQAVKNDVSKAPFFHAFEEFDPSTPLAICYTSGTTGRPKGAVIDQFTATTRALRIMYELRLDSSDTMHMTTPMFHISSLILSLAGLQRGAAQFILPQFDYDLTIPTLKENGVTFINTVPTILSMALSREDFNAEMFASLRLIMYTAAPMSLPLLRKLAKMYDGDLIQFLGQTEDLPQTVLTPEDHHAAQRGEAEGRLTSVGRPCAGVELMICDDYGRRLPDGDVGEIVTRSGMAMSGYWNLSAETAQTLNKGWVYTGDLGWRDGDGYIYLCGRKKQMIIRGGENVYPAEVEPVLMEVPVVRDAVIIGLPDDTWGEIVVAAVVTTDGSRDERGIIDHCQARLASFRCPERIFFFDKFPLNAAGKVERNEVLLRIEKTLSDQQKV